MIAILYAPPNKIYLIISLTFAPREDKMLIKISYNVTIAARYAETDFHDAT